MRTLHGQMRWVDAGDEDVALLDQVTMHVDGLDERGQVFIAPDQLSGVIPQVNAVLISLSRPSFGDTPCTNLPGSRMPYLGSEVSFGGVVGVVTQIDPVAQQVVVTQAGGDALTTTVDELDVYGA